MRDTDGDTSRRTKQHPLKSVAKAIGNAVAFGMVLPCLAAYWMTALLMGRERAFPGWSQALSLLPGLTGVYLRRAFYRGVFTRLGEGGVISFGTVFSHPSSSMGAYAYVGAFCGLGEVTLEDDVLIGSHVSIMNGGQQHGIERLDVPVREQPGVWPRITIGRDSWIGDRAIIMASVGRHCVVGAGSVVTRLVPDYAIVVGNPARIVGDRRRLATNTATDSQPGKAETNLARSYNECVS